MKARYWLPALALAACGGSTVSNNTDAADSADMAPAGAHCAAGMRTGAAGGNDAFYSPSGTLIIVRTPSGYDPLVGSPLVVVFSAANKDSADTEKATALTAPATGRGYIVAYIDHITPQTDADVQTAADAAKAVMGAWCVDDKRIYLTGHSDGGTMTHLVTLAGLVDAAAIAPSAAGVNGGYMAQSTCPARATPHFEIHSSGDSLFPIAQGFGPDVAKWYAACAGCSATPSAPDADACVVYPGCMGGAEVRYCEGTGKHGTWPTDRDPAVLDFFDRFKLP